MFEYEASGNLVFGGDAAEFSSYYSYVGSGVVLTKRCGNIVVYLPKKLLVVRFVEGDIAWIRYEAERGKIRSVLIKRLKITSGGLKTLGRSVVVYFDNLNAIYDETDLITHSSAVATALAYHQRRLYEAQKAIECI